MSETEKAAFTIKSQGLMIILRTGIGESALYEAAQAIYAAGVRAVEITIDSDGALRAIERIRRELPDGCVLGAGTIRSLGEASQACEAGAEFLVSPCFQDLVSDYCHAVGALYVPGVLSPSEAQTALEAGWPLQKMFPAAPVGAAYLRALKAPLRDIDFVAVGGVDATSAAAFFDAGATAVGIGGGLLGSKGENVDLDGVRQRASDLVRIVSAVKGSSR